MIRNRDGTRGPLHITTTGRELRPVDRIDLAYAQALIETAIRATETAREVCELHGLAESHERLTWALDFQRAARDKLPREEGC